jgi:hypothetical protein
MTPTTQDKEMFDQIYALAMINGFALLKYDTMGGFEIVKPEQYNDLIAAINWQKDNKVKL